MTKIAMPAVTIQPNRLGDLSGTVAAVGGIVGNFSTTVALLASVGGAATRQGQAEQGGDNDGGGGT